MYMYNMRVYYTIYLHVFITIVVYDITQLRIVNTIYMYVYYLNSIERER